MWLKIQVVAIYKLWPDVLSDKKKYLFLQLTFKCIRHNYSMWNFEVMVSKDSLIY